MITQHFPKLRAFIPTLEEMLLKNETRSRKERFCLTRIYDDKRFVFYLNQMRDKALLSLPDVAAHCIYPTASD